jgi:hypothetical protein
MKSNKGKVQCQNQTQLDTDKVKHKKRTRLAIQANQLHTKYTTHGVTIGSAITIDRENHTINTDGLPPIPDLTYI